MVSLRLHVGDAPRPPVRIGSARSRPRRLYVLFGTALAAGLITAAVVWPAWRTGLFWVLDALFGLAVALRVLLLTLAFGRRARRIATPPLSDAELPTYTVIVPLHDEARIAPALIKALSRIEYPRDRLEILFALEPSDPKTVAAVLDAAVAEGVEMQAVIAEPEAPLTKPKACNAALAHARGRLVVVYDAEDVPHPGQLREAAARFAAAPAHLGCLQAPLRVTAASGSQWLTRQYMLEYAALFDVMLPGFVRLGLPFPLGGTSNHFRREALDEAGGWDAWNVTEDADMGLRLAALGWSLGVLSLPTGETAPEKPLDWYKQRARWIKGHMQTWGVHARHPLVGGWRRTVALPATIGLSVASAVLHGWLDAWLLGTIGWAALSQRWPDGVWLHAGLLTTGVLSAWGCIVLGCVIGGRRVRLGDLLTSPAYWLLQSIAALRAIWELVVCPFYWNKTPHAPPHAEAASPDRA